jgi:hypothetical protein
LISFILLNTYFLASSFEQNGVAPDAVHFSDFFTVTDLAETAVFVDLDAGRVFRKNACLQGPKFLLFAARDQGF